MTPKQISAIQALTSRVDAAARYATISTDYLDGPVVSSIHSISEHDGAAMVCMQTVTERWFEKHCHAIVWVSKRGALKISLREGFARYALDPKISYRRARAAIRAGRLV